MDEVINYQDQESLEDNIHGISSSEWQMEHISFMEREESKMLLQYQNYHLHFIQKKESQTYRRMIPSTKIERLAFYRNYVTSPNRAMRVFFEVKGFIWLYIINVFFKVIPHTFINVFMASYSPEQHSFLVGMSPCFYGAKFIIIMAGIFELIYFSKNLVLLVDYILRGVFYKSPWNRCSMKMPNTDVNYTCRSMSQTMRTTLNRNLTTEVIDGLHFYVINGERFMLVQLEYFCKRLFHMNYLTDRFYFCLLWFMVALTAHYIFKRSFWKIFNVCQMTVMTLFLIVYIHTTLYFIQNLEELKRENITVTEYAPAIMFSDIDILLEVTVAPPIIHILTSRSLQEIIPTRDSAFIVVSNTLFYIFRGLITYRLQRHCELITNSPITVDYNFLCWYYLFPIYLHSFFLGDLYTLFYFIINFVVEFCTFMVAFQCLVEFMAVEWIYINRICLTIITFLCGVSFYIASPVNMDYISLFGKLTVNIMECIIIYFLYPLPRLIDDMTFHYGILPTKMRVVTLKLVVVVSCVIFYVCFSCLSESASKNHKLQDGEYFVICIMPLTLILGFFYALVLYLVKKKVNFRSMLVPEESWGPCDFNLRQLRKQYDSRFYIGSQAPRYLSRYLISKRETECYRLDLRYESDRRSTMATTDYRKENEKKLL